MVRHDNVGKVMHMSPSDGWQMFRDLPEAVLEFTYFFRWALQSQNNNSLY